MSGLSTILPVPYFTQPTGITCQSTVLKMMAAYFEQHLVLQSTGAADKHIQSIWKEINTGSVRPTQARNAHVNMKWWLEQHFPTLRFSYMQTRREDEAVEAIVKFIDGRFPVLVSVSHARVAGHIILAIGYDNYAPGMSSADFELVAHDPYGRFEPTLLSNAYGARRYEGGASLVAGGETGPGRAVRLPITALSRHRVGDAREGTYYLLSGSW